MIGPMPSAKFELKLVLGLLFATTVIGVTIKIGQNEAAAAAAAKPNTSVVDVLFRVERGELRCAHLVVGGTDCVVCDKGNHSPALSCDWSRP